MESTPVLLKQHIWATLQQLPEETLPEVLVFLESMQYKKKQPEHPSYYPIALGGIWSNTAISDDAIAEVRREMWHGFGERGDL